MCLPAANLSGKRELFLRAGTECAGIYDFTYCVYHTSAFCVQCKEGASKTIDI